MGLIRVQGVSKQFGPRVVLQDITLDLHTGEKVGLVGTNGSGKTTLFRIVAGEIAPDFGTVTASKGLRIGYLPQEPEIAEDKSLHDEVLSAFAELLEIERKLHDLSDQISQHPVGTKLSELMVQYDRTTARFEAAGGYSFEQKLDAILTGLGFSQADYGLPLSVLSGGQKCRAALGRMLLQESDFLLLDEPTNHLDIDAVRWLEKFLAGHDGGAVIVSHDRYLLDRVADRIVEIDNGRVQSYPGNYTSFLRTKEVRQLTQERQFEKDQAFIEKERNFIAKHMGSQRTAEAKGRRTRLERRLKAGEFTLETPTETRRVKIAFDNPDDRLNSGGEVLEVRELSMGYGEKSLFRDLSFRLSAGQRLGITGPNGTGKTTLLKIILGQLTPLNGTSRFTRRLTMGYYAQETSELNPERTVVEEILSVRPDMLEAGARSYAARFLFRGEDPFKRLGQLSGGEQSRVRLMKIILSSPDMLIFDEPTNHLDIPSREVLEEALLDFPGTILAVSHDRYFLDRICNRLLVMRPEGHALYNGNYSYYLEQVEAQRVEAEATEAVAKPSKPLQSDRDPKSPRTSKSVSPFTKLTLEDLEAFIIEREERLADLNERFGDPGVYQDAGAITKLRDDFESVKAELREAEAEWSTRSE